jgi:methylamine dehydrogenase light chain
MNWLDELTEKSSRSLAQKTSRRNVLTSLSALLLGGATVPLLPVARAAGNTSNGYPGVAEQSTGVELDPGNPASCDYWRYCAIDGFLCSCCGGTQNSCPPGTEMSPITWIGTCQNPADGKNYIISYNDCCGTTSCGRCLCNRNESDTPVYRAQTNNDTNWCLGTQSTVYNCSTAVILGVALDGK